MGDGTPRAPSDQNRAYYDRNAAAYAAETRGIDISSEYEPFLAHVPAGGHVLDAGSGSGRDTAAFLDRGYQVTAFDASPELAAISTAATGVNTHVLTFAEVGWERQFDGIWANASLLHVPAADLDDALARLVRALKPGGILSASFKEGEGAGLDDRSRFMQYHSERGLCDRVERLPEITMVRLDRSDDPRGRDVRWLRLLALKDAEAEPAR